VTWGAGRVFRARVPEFEVADSRVGVHGTIVKLVPSDAAGVDVDPVDVKLVLVVVRSRVCPV